MSEKSKILLNALEAAVEARCEPGSIDQWQPLMEQSESARKAIDAYIEELEASQPQWYSIQWWNDDDREWSDGVDVGATLEEALLVWDYVYGPGRISNDTAKLVASRVVRRQGAAE